MFWSIVHPKILVNFIIITYYHQPQRSTLETSTHNYTVRSLNTTVQYISFSQQKQEHTAECAIHLNSTSICPSNPVTASQLLHMWIHLPLNLRCPACSWHISVLDADVPRVYQPKCQTASFLPPHSQNEKWHPSPEDEENDREASYKSPPRYITDNRRRAN